jgi:hypothetical protein
MNMKRNLDLPDKKAPVSEQQWFDYASAGAYIGKTKGAVRKYVSNGWIKTSRRGGKLRFISRAELDRFCAGEVSKLG